MSWLWLELPFMFLAVLIAVVPLVWALATEGRAQRAEEQLRINQGCALSKSPDLGVAWGMERVATTQSPAEIAA